jgi:hypothetical protein
VVRTFGSRRIMQHRIEHNALELLHAIREHHPDIYAGAWVNPSTAALERAEESRELERGPLYTITLRGMRMLPEV